jgi:hypothetical protein
MELVDPNVPPPNLHTYQFYATETGRSRKEGWGSAEATEMVLNNIFYITAKVSYWESPISITFDVCNFQFGDNHSKEIEEVWATLCTSWPNNMKVIIRYLIIISGMAPCELLPYVSGESVLNCVHRNVLNITDKTSSLVSSKSTAG